MASSQDERDQVAQEMFGKKFDECDSMERVKVGGHIGGKRGGGRIREMAQEYGEGRQGGEGEGMEGEGEAAEEEPAAETRDVGEEGEEEGGGGMGEGVKAAEEPGTKRGEGGQ